MVLYPVHASHPQLILTSIAVNDIFDAVLGFVLGAVFSAPILLLIHP